jgi:hypothetical protein
LAPGYAKGWNAAHAGKPALSKPDADGYGYGEFNYGRKRIRARSHRVIFVMMTGREPELVDHRDFDTSNNRWANLREATHRTNSCNRRKWAKKTLPKGVMAGKKGVFLAQAGHNGVRHYLGTFPTVEAAHAAYRAKAAELHGSFFHDGARADDIFG